MHSWFNGHIRGDRTEKLRKTDLMWARERNCQERKQATELVQASDFELHMFFEYKFYSFGGAGACCYLKHNFGDTYQKQKSHSSSECTNEGYLSHF